MNFVDNIGIEDITHLNVLDYLEDLNDKVDRLMGDGLVLIFYHFIKYNFFFLHILCMTFMFIIFFCQIDKRVLIT